jgi:histidine phosphotransferase ChpT
MQETNEMQLAELLMSRLCHDLISPVGAIGNGLELMEEDDDAIAAEAMELTQQSARRAAWRLQFFRLAFGASGDRAAIGLKEVQDLAVGFLDGRKTTLEWPENAPGSLPAGAARLILLLVLLAADALPRGGVISLAVDSGASPRLRVGARGQEAHLRPEVAAALGAGQGEAAIATVAAFFAGRFARRIGAGLGVVGGGDAVILEARLAGG